MNPLATVNVGEVEEARDEKEKGEGEINSTETRGLYVETRTRKSDDERRNYHLRGRNLMIWHNVAAWFMPLVISSESSEQLVIRAIDFS